MIEPMGAPLRYHQATFELAGWTPELDRERLATLDALAAARGDVLPASVREWFALANGRAFREEHSLPNFQVRLRELGIDDGDEAETLAARPGLVYFMAENQGVGGWAYDATSGADPWVYTQADGGEPWEPLHMRFAEFQLQHTVDHLRCFGWEYQRLLTGETIDVDACARLLPGFRRLAYADSPALARFVRGRAWLDDYVEIGSTTAGLRWGVHLEEVADGERLVAALTDAGLADTGRSP